MNMLLQLSLFGSILTLLFMAFRKIYLKKCGGRWYAYMWLFILMAYCVPYRIGISTDTKIQQASIFTSAWEEMIPMTANAVVGNITKEQTFTWTIMDIFTLVYFIGLVLVVLHYVYCFYKFQKNIVKKSSVVTDADLQVCFFQTCKQLSVKQKIILKQNDDITTPIFTGIFKPTIILPIQRMCFLEPNMVFQHELVHYKRHDILYRFFALLIHMIHWFNPISYFALQAMQEACELACDEEVTQNMTQPQKKMYGMMLLSQATSQKIPFVASFGIIKNKKRKIKRRLSFIMSQKKQKNMLMVAGTVFAMVLCSQFFEWETIYANVSNQSTKDIQYQITHTQQICDESNRALTQEEQQRLKQLQYQYQNEGVRPEKQISFSSENQTIYFDIQEQKYYYPQQLSDEELLQLIDWRYKMNQITLGTQMKSEIKSTQMQEAEAIDFATEKISHLFDVNANVLHNNATYYKDNSIQPDGWMIRSADDKNGILCNYAVWIYDNGQGWTVSRSNPEYNKTISFSEQEGTKIEEDKRWENEVKYILQTDLSEDRQILSINDISSNHVDEKQKTITIQAVLSDTTSYMLTFYPNHVLKEISYRVNVPVL